MPCLHVAIISHGGSKSNRSSSNCCSCLSFEHHAIFDRDKDQYIHVTPNQDGEMRVITTLKRAFESYYSTRPRVVKLPATVEQAHQIVARARSMAAGDGGGAWEYDPLKNNCEHFVNQCWDPFLPPRSAQAEDVVASIGSSSVIGAIGGGAVSTIMAASMPAATATASTFWAGTVSTVVSSLSWPAVVSIGAVGTVLGGGISFLTAYGLREWVLADAAANASLLPIAVYNTSSETITASLRNGDGMLVWLWDGLYQWRAWNGVGIMSCDIASNMAEELNPPTGAHSQDTRFVLTMKSQPDNPDKSISCYVSRGDVVLYDGQTSRIAKEVEREQCGICLDRPANTRLRPCSCWQLCDQCIRKWMKRGKPCPFCAATIESIDVAKL